MNLLDRFRTASARKAQAIAEADAVAAQAAARRQAELDAMSARARTRAARIEAAVALLADKIEPLALALRDIDVEYELVTGVVLRAFRRADERCGLCSESLHWCELSPTASELRRILGTNMYFIKDQLGS